MPMNQVIREKRKELGLTQEQVADRLGVTAPAVNKWEKGSTYPDIGLLPPLARLLEVDLNALLCFREELTQQEVNDLVTALGTTIQNEGFAAGYARAMEQVREYPGCDRLLNMVALQLDGALMLSGLPPAEKETYEAGVLDLYERAAQGRDESIRNRALFMLVSKYTNSGAYDKAEALLERLPEQSADKRQLQAHLLMRQDRLEEAALLLEQKVQANILLLQGDLDSLSEIARREGAGEAAEQLASISSRIAETCGLGEYQVTLPRFLAAVARKDVRESLALAETMLEAARFLAEQRESPLRRHLPRMEAAGLNERFAARAISALLADLEHHERYAFLRGNAEFQDLIRRYRARYGAAAE